ncbi:MCE family protein [Mycolicibacterium sp. XJ1819]
MKQNLPGALVRVIVFTVVCLLFTFAFFAIFADLRFGNYATYRALFTDVTGLETGQFVRIAGVEVGQVKKITVQPDSTVLVDFTTEDSVVLTEGSRAVIRYADLIGGRYLALEEGAGSAKRLVPGQTISISRTAPALDLDALIGGFRPLFNALSPMEINKLTGQLIRALQGQGDTIGSFLKQVTSLTNTLADRDKLIEDVITNLNTVLGSLGEKAKELDKAVDALSELVHGLTVRGPEISTSVAYANSAANGIADLLSRARPPLKKTVDELDRVADLASADQDYLDNLINTLPDKYRALNRQALYGDFFSFYLCDAVLKLNGKGGQPVYVKVAGQSSGRCAPK